MSIAPEYPSRIARVGSVLALMGSLLWVQWPVDFDNFNIAAIVLFIASLFTWASIELADYRDNMSYNDNILSDDADKLNSLIDIIDSNQFYILKHKHIQTYMGEDDYKGLRKIIDYFDNDIFPFHNGNIQKLYNTFCKNAFEFCMEFYGLYTYDGLGRSTWRSSGDRFVSEEIYQSVVIQIADLDQKASKLAELWEELVTTARRELKGASKPINRYEI